jgi:arabinan endo-1,5-alpha-L-arabinosidase
MNRNAANTDWWESHGRLYAGGVPGGLVVNGLYRQVYTCNGAIGIMTARGKAPHYKWTDLGEPIVTWVQDKIPRYGSLIDVSLMIDFEKRLWLVHGCGSIFIVELDPYTLKLKQDPENTVFSGDRWTHIGDGGRNAEDPTMEGAFIFPHEHEGTRFYYLFATWGENSIRIWNKYQIMVGRATSPTGPYIDKEGRRMDLEHGPGSGGTVLLDDSGSIIGDSRYQIPGHPGICEYPVKTGGTKFVFSFHFHPDRGYEELLAAKQMVFDKEGWPVVLKEDFDPTEAGQPKL